MRKNIVKLAKRLTQDVRITLGQIPMDEKRPEYSMLDTLLNDEQCELMLHMKQRRPVTVGEMVKRTGWEEERVSRVLEEVAKIGLIEYNWHNERHEKQYVIPVFVVGSAENLILNNDLVEKYPLQVGKFQDKMAYLPLEPISHMVPPGGAGMGFHVIPIESAIPKESQSLDIEHVSHWLEKYRNQIATGTCVCRRSMRLQGKGCGELEDEVCVYLGDYATYLVETGRAKPATYEEAVALMKRTEENGYMHQVTNGDGPDEIFAICNCTLGSCYGLRCSQLFNNPNMSASAYRAKVDPDKCVACGKCVEVCPSGAARLGQRLCTSHGEVSYPKQPLPDQTPGWSRANWNFNYREDNQRNCYDTGTAPCKTACPAHIAVQGYVQMAGEGRYDEALELIKQDNPFPAVCGSICNKRCEDACTRGKVDAPLSVDEIKKFIAQRELDPATRYVPPIRRHSGTLKDFTQKIAVIGAGPAGLTCAYFLAAMSYPVTVFDKDPIPGGMLTKGIPNFRLEKDVVNAEIEVLKELGVEFKCGVEVGKDITIAELREQGYKAFYVAIGLQTGLKLNVEGEDLEGVNTGIDFLRAVNRGEINALSGDTVVIGGGNAAIDVSRAVTRLGEGSVKMFCLESDAEMPTVPDEKNEAVAEGVLINNCWGPKRILGENGKVTGVEFMRCLSVRDENGRFAPKYDPEETVIVPCSHVFVSIGQRSSYGKLLEGTAIEAVDGHIIKADPVTFQTAESDIFVGGDIATGPKFTIDAIATGREGATSIHRFVHEGHDLTICRNLHQFNMLDRDDVVIPIEKMHVPARQPVVHDESKTRTMMDNRVPLTEEQVKLEASRCLRCGRTVVDQNKCIGCGICTTRCHFDAIHLERNHPEFASYINGDYSQQAAMKHGIKRAVKLTIKQAGEKITRHVEV